MKAVFVLQLAWLFLLPTPAEAQELPRRSFPGIQMEALSEDVRKLMGVEETGDVLINNVVPTSTASAAGFQKRDILLRLNDQQLTDIDVGHIILSWLRGQS